MVYLQGTLVQEDKPKLELEDGIHYGKIKSAEVSIRGGFNYMDIALEIDDGNDIKSIRAGYPLPCSPNSMTGKFLKRFGLDVVPDKEIDLNPLIGLDCQFLTTKGSKYIEVNRESVMPVK